MSASSTITRIDPGPRMSDAVIHGNTVYCAGQVAGAAKGGSVAEQTADVLAQIDALLAKCGTSKAKILSATIILSNISTFAEMNSVWDAWVDRANPPARATIEARLAAPAYAVEIVVIAAI
jgi:enamine deaminase RidA (YjgF/YER057c/UK114 family)